MEMKLVYAIQRTLMEKMKLALVAVNEIRISETKNKS